MRDVTEQAELFAHNLELAEEEGLPIPMVRIPEVGKVPILNFYQGAMPPMEPDRMWAPEEILFESPATAREGFFAAMRQFLEYRIAGYAFWKKIIAVTIQKGAILNEMVHVETTVFSSHLFLVLRLLVRRLFPASLAMEA